MNRIAILTQAATVAFLLSAAAAAAYRSGGRRRLWLVSGLSLAVLEVLLVWYWVSSPREGPFWLATLGIIPPVLLVSYFVEILARRRVALPVQIIAGTATGIVGYIFTAFVAYILLVTLL